MTHDLVIRNGQVVDGTGADPIGADVAIDGDRITAVGEVDGRGHREIDADGQLVTPGFVDIHTHLDAQLAWDPTASSSCWHGVTTIVVGNCGVTFAPVRAGDHEYLAAMMESVEDIPKASILTRSRGTGRATAATSTGSAGTRWACTSVAWSVTPPSATTPCATVRSIPTRCRPTTSSPR